MRRTMRLLVVAMLVLLCGALLPAQEAAAPQPVALTLRRAIELALQNSKDMLREHVKNIGINIPRAIVLPVYQPDFDGPRDKYATKAAMKVFEKFPSPWIVKSFTPDLSMGIHLAKTFPQLVESIEDGVNHGQSI